MFRSLSPVTAIRIRRSSHVGESVTSTNQKGDRVHFARGQCRGVVFQVAHALNCPTTSDSELAICLRNQDVDRLLHVKIHKPKYVPAYAPLIDRAVIPDKPVNLMENVQLFGRYDFSVR